MTTTSALRQLGQSLWLDNITRALLDSGTLARYKSELGVTGLTSNPTIYDRAIGGSGDYDAQIAAAAAAGVPAEEIFFGLALDDLTRAADLFRPVYDATDGIDGFVSLEVSPELAYDAVTSLAEAKRLWAKGGRANLLIKIPGTPQGLGAIEDAIFAGIPINVTLLFSPAQYLGCAEAYTRGIERRLAAGLPAYVPSVASLFVSRWDGAVKDKIPAELELQLGLAVGRRAYADAVAFFATERWAALKAAGARPQRLLFASTGTKDPTASPTLYVTGLAAPNTVNTIPEETLLAAGADDLASVDPIPAAPGEADAMLARFAQAGIDVDAVGLDLQQKGAASFVASWTSLLARVSEKSGT
ncbi:MAG TPA: transaldolase [Candidatus Limnocylindrales bacterium]